MMQMQNRFKIQTFNQNGQQYLYEIFIDGNNSLIKIYDSNTKLRSTQRMNIPAQYSVYTCQNYLILLSPQDIQLLKLPNVSLKMSSKNPGIKEIRSCSYNKKLNIILLLDKCNQLYYLMPQIKSVSVKKIYDGGQISGSLTKVAVDNKCVVYLLCEQTNILYDLKYDWNRDDKLVQINEIQNIVDIYCRFQWKVCVSMLEGDEDNYRLTMSQNDDQFQNCVPKHDRGARIRGGDQRHKPVIKCSTNDMVYLDGSTKTVVLINNKQQIYNNNDNIVLAGKSGMCQSSVMFKISKQNYSSINLQILYYTGLRQPFTKINIPIKWLQVPKQEQLLLYIHNNIHLILGTKGINVHFYDKVKSYLGIFQTQRRRRVYANTNKGQDGSQDQDQDKDIDKDEDKDIDKDIDQGQDQDRDRDRDRERDLDSSYSYSPYLGDWNRGIQQEGQYISPLIKSLNSLFLRKLLTQQPNTMMKLAQHLVTEYRHTYLAYQLQNYLGYLEHCILSALKNAYENTLEGFKSTRNHEIKYQKFKKGGQMLINLIAFLGILVNSISAQENTSFIFRLKKKYQLSAPTLQLDEEIQLSFKYQILLQQAKGAYLSYLVIKQQVNQIHKSKSYNTNKNNQRNHQNRQNMRMQQQQQQSEEQEEEQYQNDDGYDDYQYDSYERRLTKKQRRRLRKARQKQGEQQHLKFMHQGFRTQIRQDGDYFQSKVSVNQKKLPKRRKLGTNACHQIFQNWIQGQKINKHIVFKFLIQNKNFYYAAYFYLFLDQSRTRTTIPYISDPQTVQLIRFLTQNTIDSVIKERQKHRQILKLLPPMTSKALLINQPSFLQFICGLSINTQQYKCCLAILLSGVQDQWPKMSRNFIIDCLILCDRSLLAYQKLEEYSSDPSERQKLLQNFVNFCIKQKKIKDLFQLSSNSEDNKYIRSKLTESYGSQDVKQIIQLMKQLNKQQQQKYQKRQ